MTRLTQEQIAEVKAISTTFKRGLILDLIADLEETRARLDVAEHSVKVLTDELADVRAVHSHHCDKLAVAEKDAGRYQYLREIGVTLDGHDFLSAGPVADFRIDAAIAAQEGK